MKALVGAFNQEKALVGAFSMIVQPVVEPMDRFAALVLHSVIYLPCLFLAMSRLSFILCCSLPAASHSLLTLAPAPGLTNSRLMPRSSSAMPAHNSSVD